jgi:HlyD family secretion protein
MSGSRAAIFLIIVALFVAGGLFGSVPPVDSLLAPPAQAALSLRALIDRWRGRQVPEGLAKANGRIEATQVDVAPKYAGRLASVSVREGDEVSAGQVVARISAPEYEAQLRSAQAQVLRAKKALAESEAVIAQRKSDLAFAQTEFDRGQEFDQRSNQREAADAALRAANAQREQAAFAIKSAEADVDRLEAILVDLELVAPRSGRIQYKLARAGEVVSAGTRVLTILDLHDVYMTIFLPAAQAGLLILGDEARLIVDPLPQYVVPATVGGCVPVLSARPRNCCEIQPG